MKSLYSDNLFKIKITCLGSSYITTSVDDNFMTPEPGTSELLFLFNPTQTDNGKIIDLIYYKPTDTTV